jgi:hypothetical protein
MSVIHAGLPESEFRAAIADFPGPDRHRKERSLGGFKRAKCLSYRPFKSSGTLVKSGLPQLAPPRRNLACTLGDVMCADDVASFALASWPIKNLARLPSTISTQRKAQGKCPSLARSDGREPHWGRLMLVGPGHAHEK